MSNHSLRPLRNEASGQIEAYRREEISQGKLRDLSKLLNFSAKAFVMLAEAA